jgi:branched-chain amino acid transport system permease protein
VSPGVARQRLHVHPISWLFLFGVAAAPFVAGTDDHYALTLLVTACIYVTFTLGQTLLLGFAGQVSLGHAAFYGVGAYTAGVLAVTYEVPFPLAFFGSILLPAVLAWAIGGRLLRFQPFYLAMATLVTGIIASEVFNAWSSVTGGPSGLFGIPAPTVAGFAFDSPYRMYWLTAAVMLVALWVGTSLVKTHVGRALKAVRADEVVAASCGVDVAQYKLRIFSISAGLAGAAGALYAYFTSFISPESFGLDLSILVVAMAVIGGLGSARGAVIGAAFLVIFPEFTRQYGEWRDLIYGIVLFATLVFLPGGLWGLIADAFSGIGRRLHRSAKADAAETA